ncbi:MAG: restriction endonuclease, partial [Bacteroidales bacterium]|nr:restriction endonuclease [Bacteroidales bacterium]
MSFVEKIDITTCSWQAFERMICRLLAYEGFQNIRLVGGSGDRGADVIATKFNKRWLFQAKQWKSPVGIDVVLQTLEALKEYNASLPVIVASRGFNDAVRKQQHILQSNGIPLQLWDAKEILRRASLLPQDRITNNKTPRE